MSTPRVAVIVAALALSVPAGLGACGDKFLVPGRGARFKAKVKREAASVLLYLAPGTGSEQTVRTLAFEARLRAAGYRPTLSTTHEDFEAVVGNGRWDVVAIDIGGAPALAARLRTARVPVVLPVTYAVPKGTLESARRQFRHVLDLSKTRQTWLDVVDEAVAAGARARAKSPSQTGA